MTYKKPEIHARLPQEQFDRLVDISDQQRCSLSELIRRIITDYLQTPQESESHLKQYYCLMSQADKKLFEEQGRNNNTSTGFAVYRDDDGNVVVDDSPVDSQKVLNALKDIANPKSGCTPADCVTKNQGSLSRLLLTQLELYLDGFVCETENVLGDRQGFAWGFGLNSSDYFETAEDCLSNFLGHLNGLSFNYKNPAAHCIPDVQVYEFGTHINAISSSFEDIDLSRLQVPETEELRSNPEISDGDLVDW